MAPNSTMSLAAGLALALAAAGCRTGGPELRVVGPASFAAPEDFPGAAVLLTPAPAPSPAADADADPPGERWLAGDEVLFGLRLERAGTRRHWLLHLRLTEPFAVARPGEDDAGRTRLPPVTWWLRVNGVETPFVSAQCRVLATVADEHGNVLERSEPLLPRDFLARGFAEACELVAQRRLAAAGADFYRAADVQPFAQATVAAIALLEVVQADAVLAPLLWHVVDRPSIWSVVTNLGVEVTVRPRFHAAEPAPSPAAVGPSTWRVPMALLVNGDNALLADLYVAPSAPPLALCGGVVAALARHPSDPGLEFSLVLLGARRGTAGG